MTDPKPPDRLRPDNLRPDEPAPRAAEPLTERVADWRPAGFAVDAAGRCARGVALCGPASRNGYRWAYFRPHCPRSLKPPPNRRRVSYADNRPPCRSPRNRPPTSR